MSFTGSSSNRAQLAYKLEGAYPTNFGVPQGGNGTLFAMTAETLDFQIKNTQSKAIRADRQISDLVQIGANAQGGINVEHIYREADPFMQGAIQSDFVAYGTNGVTAAIATLTFSALTITAGAAPVGVDAFTVLKKGQWFAINPPAGATAAVKLYLAGRAFRISTTTAPSATVITLDASTPLDVTAAGVGASMAGGTLGSSYAWNGNVMKSYTLEVGYTDIGQFRQYAGMITSKMDVQFASGAIVTLGFEFLGKFMNLLQATSMGTPTASQTFTPANATRGVVDIFEGGVGLSATTYLKTGSFTIDNTLRSMDAVSVFGLAGVGAGTQNITGKFDAYFVDATLYTKFLNGTASSLSIPIVDNAGNGYVYYFPRIKYTTGKLAVAGQDQDNMLTCDWQATPETDATSPWFGKSCVIFRVGA